MNLYKVYIRTTTTWEDKKTPESSTIDTVEVIASNENEAMEKASKGLMGWSGGGMEQHPHIYKAERLGRLAVEKGSEDD